MLSGFNPLRPSAGTGPAMPQAGGAPRTPAPAPESSNPCEDAIRAVAKAVETGQVQGLSQQVEQLLGGGGMSGGQMPASEPEGDEGY